MNHLLSDSTSWNAGVLQHSTSELWAMVTFAADHGIDVDRCLVGTLLDLDTLCHRRARVSFSQQLEIQRRIALLVSDVQWPLRVAARLHLTSYGMAGYALLSSSTLTEAVQLARRYAPLLNLKHQLCVQEIGSTAHVQLQPGYRLEPEQQSICDVMELLKLANLLRDMLGAAFVPSRARVGHAHPAHLEALAERLGCEVETGAPTTEICFDERLLRQSLPQSDPATCRSSVEACQQQLEDACRFNLIGGRVRALVESCIGELPTMPEVARRLCMSPRSLRRRLDAEGTSFHEIVDGMRKDMAERFLRTTTMSTEAIAEVLGYGDAANFRHAFKRWTGDSPRRFRNKHADVDPVPVEIDATALGANILGRGVPKHAGHIAHQ